MSSAATIRVSCGAILVGLLATTAVAGRPLSFDQRVRAQEAIERAYYRHLTGATRPFEQAVSRELLERKVRDYLVRSVALDRLRQVRLTTAMLERELSRIAASTRLPDRLREIYAALGNDPALIAECLARPVLVERLVQKHLPDLDEAEWAELEQGLDPDSVHVPPAVERLPVPDGAVAPSVLDPDCVPDDTWNNGVLEPDIDVDRLGHTAVWTGTEMIVWGGGGLASGMRYDPVLDVWSPISDAGAPAGRLSHLAVWTGTEMIVWGGRATLFGPSLATGGRYNPSSDTWLPVAMNGAPTGRTFASHVWTGSELIVWSGDTGDGPPLPNTGARYRPATDSWTAMTTTDAPVGRAAGVFAWTGQVMVVWGGRTGQGGPDLQTGGRYDPVADSWAPTTLASALDGRADASWVWTGTELAIWSGSLLQQSGGRYDPVSDSWTSMSTVSAPPGRFGGKAVWTGGQMLVWGGQGLGGPATPGGRYQPASDTWLTMSAAGQPAPRSGPSAVWTGTEMIVWGGGSQDGTGGRYAPQSDAWTPTLVPPQDAPPSREDHTLVWTGTHTIAWGGFVDGSTVSNSGTAYDPLLDAWTPTTLTGAPSPRSRHGAVWTGQEMLVWGGRADGSPGGRYDPVTKTWAPISSTDQPAPRWGHTAVWTGTRMVVWGGTNSDAVPQDPSCEEVVLAGGAAYDPSSNTWTPMPSTGSAGRRRYHTAVWTGTEMIAWGGERLVYTEFPAPGCVFIAQSTGEKLDPVAGTFTTIAAPAPLSYHAAVWTGTEMVVWGPFGSTATWGAVYDPASNVWDPISLTGAPERRASPAAVWTGSEMIIWGAGTDTGGRYSVASDSWSATTTWNAPRPMRTPEAVWTGDAMIVMGLGGGRYFVGQPDLDSDGTADACDPCPLDEQNDIDLDGYCADVDNCADAANGLQRDDDADGVGSLCDNCPATANSAQADLDGDHAGDACDCMVEDPTDRSPPPVEGLVAAKVGTTVHLSWDAAPSADRYAVTRGELDALSVGQYGSCLVNDLTGLAYDDEALPLAGSGYSYLIQAVSFECGPGSLGVDSSEAERDNGGATCGGLAFSDHHPQSESSVFGTVSGSLADTLSTNDGSETITEQLSGGNPASRFSRLEHRWTIVVPSGTTKELHVEGFRTLSTDGDDFRFAYSSDGVTFTPVVLALPLSDDDADRVAPLPGSLTGTITVRVVDTDREAGHQALDTVAVDELWIRVLP
jgi:hypothetical protein